MSPEPEPESSAAGVRRRRVVKRTAATRIAKAERAAARERERRAVLGEELRALKVEVRRLRAIVAATDAGRLETLKEQLERAREELARWKSGRR